MISDADTRPHSRCLAHCCRRLAKSTAILGSTQARDESMRARGEALTGFPLAADLHYRTPGYQTADTSWTSGQEAAVTHIARIRNRRLLILDCTSVQGTIYYVHVIWPGPDCFNSRMAAAGLQHLTYYFDYLNHESFPSYGSQSGSRLRRPEPALRS